MIAFHFDFNFAHFRLDYLQKMLRHLRKSGYDTIIWEIENAVSFDTAPAAAARDAVTKAEFAQLLEYSRSLGLRNAPLLQTLAHTEYVLVHEEYAHLGEGDSGYLYCPSNPELYVFLEKWLTEYRELFYDAPFFHIGCDETHMLGESCPECAQFIREHGISALLVKHILRIHDILQKAGIQCAIWADMLIAHREKIRELPKDLLLFEWRYDISDNQDKLFCPGKGYCREKELPAEYSKEFRKFLHPGNSEGPAEPFYLADYLHSLGFKVLICPAASACGGSFFTGQTELRFANTFDSVRKALSGGDGCAATSWTVHLFPYELQMLALETPAYLKEHAIPRGERKSYCDFYTMTHFGLADSAPFLHIQSLLNHTPLFTSNRTSEYCKSRAYAGPEFFFRQVSAMTEEENVKEQTLLDKALSDFYLAHQEIAALRQKASSGDEELALWQLATENLIARSRFALLLLHHQIKRRMNARPLIAELTRLREKTCAMYAERLTPECLKHFMQILFDAPLAACQQVLTETLRGIR